VSVELAPVHRRITLKSGQELLALKSRLAHGAQATRPAQHRDPHPNQPGTPSLKELAAAGFPAPVAPALERAALRARPSKFQRPGRLEKPAPLESVPAREWETRLKKGYGFRRLSYLEKVLLENAPRLERSTPLKSVVRLAKWWRRATQNELPANYKGVLAASRGSEPVDETLLRSFNGSTLPERMRALHRAQVRNDDSWTRLWSEISGDLARWRRLALAELKPLGVENVDLHDGHVAELTLSAEALCKNASTIEARVPWLSHLRITKFGPVGPTVFELPLLGQLKSLSLKQSEVSESDVIALASAPRLRNLKWLDLSFNRLDYASLEAIATSVILSEVLYLGFDGNVVPSPVDIAYRDLLDGSIIDWDSTPVGKKLEHVAQRKVLWLHAPARFAHLYPPAPRIVA